MGSIIHSRPEITAPDLKGKTLHQALEAVSALGLNLALESQEHNPDVAAGIVLKQHPLGNARLREGASVRVVLSIGGERITTPEVVGLSLRKAEIELRVAGLGLGEIQERYSLQEPRRFVLDQDPKALTLIGKGELVHLVISQGEPPPEKVILPNFVGQDLAKASAWAQNYKVNLKVIENWMGSAADGTILDQNLKPDTLWNKEDLAYARPTLEITVAKRSSKATGASLEYTLPLKPKRVRDLSVRLVHSSGEQELLRIQAQPGQALKIPLPTDPNGSQRLRIYLDGVFSEEKVLR